MHSLAPVPTAKGAELNVGLASLRWQTALVSIGVRVIILNDV